MPSGPYLTLTFPSRANNPAYDGRFSLEGHGLHSEDLPVLAQTLIHLHEECSYKP